MSTTDAAKKRKLDVGEFDHILFECLPKRYKKQVVQTVIDEKMTDDEFNEFKAQVTAKKIMYVRENAWFGRYTYGIFHKNRVCWNVIRQCYNPEHNGFRKTRQGNCVALPPFGCDMDNFDQLFREKSWLSTSENGLSLEYEGDTEENSVSDGHGNLYDMEHMCNVTNELKEVREYLQTCVK